MGGIVLGERPAVNDQQAACSSLDEAGKALDVHGASFTWSFLPCHDVERLLGAHRCRGSKERDVEQEGQRSGEREKEMRWKRWGGEEGEVSGGELPLGQGL